MTGALPDQVTKRFSLEETLVALFERRVNLSHASPALTFHSSRSRSWVTLSWSAWWERSERLAAGLLELGLQRGDRVVLAAPNSPEWAVLDVAVLMSGAALAPIVPGYEAHRARSIARETRARHAIAQNPLQAQPLLALLRSEELSHLIVIDQGAALKHALSRVHLDELDPDGALRAQGRLLSLEQVGALGRRALSARRDLLVRRRRAARAEDLATIVYVDGPDGEPLGVTLTHAQVLAEIRALAGLELLDERDTHLMVLPLAGAFARVLLWAAVAAGFRTVFGRGVDLILDDMQQVQPTVLAATPPTFERFKSTLEARLLAFSSSSMRHATGALMRHAAEISRQRQRHRGARSLSPLYRPALALLQRSLYPYVSALFGSQLRFFLCGGAPLSISTAEFFHALDLLILEGYGLSQTCGAITLNTPEDYRFGSVGRRLPGVDLTLSERGEVLVKGPMCTSGYFGREALTAALIDKRGWLHTGDLGRFDEQGYLYLTGRLKR